MMTATITETAGTPTPRLRHASTVTIAVPKDIRQYFLEADIHGHGGFQSFCRQLARDLDQSRVLHLDPDQFRRMTRYATAYGEGGFQQRLRRLVSEWVSQHLDTLLQAA